MPNSTVLQRVVAVGLSVATIAWLTGVAILVPLYANAQAVVDGDLIRASGGFDVYIVKDMAGKKFRRLILNPDIFNSYGHLEWDNVKVVDQSVVDGYVDSQLVRNVDGTRVYTLVPNGEDTGDKHWLNMTAAEFVADGYDWDAIYGINEFEEDLYVSGADVASGGGAPVSGPVSVSLAPGSPAAATAPKTADNVSYGTWRFNGSGTVSTLTFTRRGVGATGDFSAIYLYDGNVRLTSGRVVNSSTNQVIFGSLNLAVNGARDLSLLADVAGNSGNVHYFEFSSASDVVLSGGVTAGGSYPVAANSVTFGGQDAGTITAAKSGNVSNPFVGALNVELSRFILAASTEDALVKRVRLLNSGSINTTELTNLYAQIDSTTVTAIANGSSDDYIDLVFSGNGYLLEKGKTKTVRVFGDVGGQRDETVILFVEESPDVWAVGQTYGFGMQTTITSFDSASSSDSHSLTIQGGDVTIAFNGPNATDIGDDTDDTPFLDLAVSSVSNIDVRKTQMHLCFYDAGSLANMTTAVLAEIEDTKIVDADTGISLNGPIDGSSWAVEAAVDTTGACTSAIKSGTYTFTEDWEVDAGTTRNISFRLDMKVDDDINNSGNDQFKAVLEGWGDLATSNGDLTVMRYRDTNKAVKSSEIVPSGDIAGNQMTVKQSSIAAALSSTPVSDTYIKGQTDINIVGIVFTAGEASDMTLTDLTLSAYVSDDATTATASYTNGDEGDGLGPDDVMTSIELVDADTGAVIAGPSGYTDNSGTNDEVQFTGLNWVIPAGQSKTLFVRGDASTTAPSGADADGIYFDVDATTDITALDADGNSRNISTANFLDGDVIATIASAGSLATAIGNDTPTSVIVVMGTGKGVGAFDDVGEGFHASDFQATATDEAFNISKVTLEQDGTNGLDAVLEMAFDYQDIDGNWFRAKGVPDGTNGEVTLTLNPNWYIPEDDSRVGRAYAAVGERSDGADSTDQVQISFSLDAGGADDQFKANGAASGTTLDDDDVTAVSSANAHHVFMTEPTFSYVSGIVTDLIAASGQEVARFSISADAHHEVLFTSASGSLEFDATASGTNEGAGADANLYKSDGTLLSSITLNDNDATFAFTFEDANLTVPAGGSVTLYIEMDLSGYNVAGDIFGIRLNGDEADNVKWLDEDNASYDVTRLGPANVIDNLPLNFGTATKD